MLNARSAGPFTEARRVVNDERQRSDKDARVVMIGKDARMRDNAGDRWRVWEGTTFDQLRVTEIRVST